MAEFLTGNKTRLVIRQEDGTESVQEFGQLALSKANAAYDLAIKQNKYVVSFTSASGYDMRDRTNEDRQQNLKGGN